VDLIFARAVLLFKVTSFPGVVLRPPEKEEPMLKEGSKAPAFCLPAAEKEKVCLKDFAGKWAVIYFYPKDNTSG
jgi:cytochrome oxidase Cu insertion factor (SCO1/SenC/PrrC family)